jgi:hypothetical protein
MNKHILTLALGSIVLPGILGGGVPTLVESSNIDKVQINSTKTTAVSEPIIGNLAYSSIARPSQPLPPRPKAKGPR